MTSQELHKSLLIGFEVNRGWQYLRADHSQRKPVTRCSTSSGAIVLHWIRLGDERLTESRRRPKSFENSEWDNAATSARSGLHHDHRPDDTVSSTDE